MKTFRYLLLVGLCLWCSGCASKIEPIKFHRSEFTAVPEFKVVTPIAKPAKPEPVFFDMAGKQVPELTSTGYIAFKPPEFAKIVALSSGFTTQADLIDELSNVVNFRIDQVNKMQQLVGIKEDMLDHMAKLYANEQAIRKEEAKTWATSDFIYKCLLLIQTGIIAVLAF